MDISEGREPRLIHAAHFTKPPQRTADLRCTADHDLIVLICRHADILAHMF